MNDDSSPARGCLVGLIVALAFWSVAIPLVLFLFAK